MLREDTCGKNSHHILNYVKSMMTSIRRSRKKCIGTNVGELTAHVPDVKNWTMSDKRTKVFFLSFDRISPCPPFAVHQAADSNPARRQSAFYPES